MAFESTPLRPRRRILKDEIPGLTNHAPMQALGTVHATAQSRQASLSPASATRHQHQRSSVI
jgi:hypothetical protein